MRGGGGAGGHNLRTRGHHKVDATNVFLQKIFKMHIVCLFIISYQLARLGCLLTLQIVAVDYKHKALRL